MTNQRRLILSSSSPARRLLLEKLAIPFEYCSPDVDETQLANESVPEMVRRLAFTKAKASVDRYPDALIIGADQVGVLNNQVLCKPLTHENAVKQLQASSGQTARYYTAMCLLDAATMEHEETIVTFDVTYRQFDLRDIENYLRRESALNCAGSLKVEGLGITLIEKMAGDDFTALIGLPLIELTSMLRRRKVEVP